MKISEIDYNLPSNLIAQVPLKKRDECKLLVYDRKKNKIEHKIFADILEYLNKDDVLVINNTKVFRARLYGRKKNGNAKIEILLLKRVNKEQWDALVKPAKRVKDGTIIIVNEDIHIEVIHRLYEGNFLIKFNTPLSYEDINRIGDVPLPPYIKREKPEDVDELFYQTVYAKDFGAVAAPTAGFHFTKSLLKKIEEKGIKITYITLHISWGTFSPIREEEVEKHKMHSEYLIIDKKSSDIINNRKGRCIGVGTSVVRGLESAVKNGMVEPFEGEVDTFIYPGYKFKIIDAMVTNFHLPKTTLILLVGAFLGVDKLKEIYQIAIDKQYRFYSYGDAMFII